MVICVIHPRQYGNYGEPSLLETMRLERRQVAKERQITGTEIIDFDRKIRDPGGGFVSQRASAIKKFFDFPES